MATKQYNLKLPLNIAEDVEEYVKSHGYRNVQDLAMEGIREKVFSQYDEDFGDDEIRLIDGIIRLGLKKKDFVSEDELNRVLLE